MNLVLGSMDEQDDMVCPLRLTRALRLRAL